MTHLKLIEANFPLYFRCLCVPVEWRNATKQGLPANSLLRLLALSPDPKQKHGGNLLEVERVYNRNRHAKEAPGEFFRATTFNPWVKRNEFFRLKKGDTAALLTFLGSVGLFARPAPEDKMASASETLLSAQDGSFHQAQYESSILEDHIWNVRRLIQESLNKLSRSNIAERHDYQVRFERSKEGRTRLILTTTTFLDALLLTLSVDRLQGATVRKCARPDCGVSFSITGGHKRKYCEWYCGHLESVRRSRKQTRKRKGVERGK